MSHPSLAPIAMLRKIRTATLKVIESLSPEQLNFIPEGFNNNIVWNLGHLVASQQGVCYLRAGLTPAVHTDFIERYKPGTKPEAIATIEEIENIKALLTSTVLQLEEDVKENKFGNYAPWVSRLGIEVNDIDDILNYIPFHEGMHFNAITTLKRFQVVS